MTRNATSNIKRERGGILVFVAISLLALFGIAALTVDMSYAYMYKRRVQAAADSASLWAVMNVQQAASVTQRAQDMFTANNLLASDVQSVECGKENGTNTFLPCSATCVVTSPETCAVCSDCRSTEVNAVRVTARTLVPSLFSRLFGTNVLPVQASSVAMATFPNSSNCVRPFGLAGGNSGPLRNVSVGDTFQISSSGSGNWGRLDVGPGTPLSGSDWIRSMMSAACDLRLVANQSVPVVTGNAQQTGQLFQSMMAAGITDQMYLPVVDSFPSGNSGSVTIQYFIIATLISVDNVSGNNFAATFRLDGTGSGIDPPNGGGSGVPNARYLRPS